jgi:hypothetical protein
MIRSDSAIACHRHLTKSMWVCSKSFMMPLG